MLWRKKQTPVTQRCRKIICAVLWAQSGHQYGVVLLDRFTPNLVKKCWWMFLCLVNKISQWRWNIGNFFKPLCVSWKRSIKGNKISLSMHSRNFGCQNRLSADQYHMTVSRSQVYSWLRWRVLWRVFFKFSLTSHWLSIWSQAQVHFKTKLNYFRNIFLKGATRVSLLALAKSKQITIPELWRNQKRWLPADLQLHWSQRRHVLPSRQNDNKHSPKFASWIILV